MSKILDQKTIAIVATDGFEQAEFFEPKQILEKAGAEIVVLSVLDKHGAQPKEIRGWNVDELGRKVEVDRLVMGARPDEFDALVLPGGQMNPDKLRLDKPAVDFVRAFVESGKPVAAICHAPWLLIEAGVVRGKTVTSWPSLSTDLKNAGAHWVDREVAMDGNLITSRKPGDISAFCGAIIAALSNSVTRYNAKLEKPELA